MQIGHDIVARAKVLRERKKLEETEHELRVVLSTMKEKAECFALRDGDEDRSFYVPSGDRS